MLRWRAAMAAALYGPDGFFVRPDNRPSAHFRTSAHVGAGFAEAIGRLLASVDTALGHPDPLDVVDIGAGRGELLEALVGSVPPELGRRLRPVAVELAAAARAPGSESGTPDAADRPGGGTLAWRRTPPRPVTGLLLATEWLDTVPVDVAEVDPAGEVRYVLVEPATGREELGPPVAGPDAAWLRRWWPLSTPGTRAEIGRPRQEEWASAVATLRRGAALAVDYGHVADARPRFGSLAGYRAGREVSPVPDGSCDITAHVAMDAVAAAGPGGAAWWTQAEALRALGLTARRPPLALAHRDPYAYLRGLAGAGLAAELADPAGLGAHLWLLQPVALPHPASWFVARLPA